MVVNVVHVIVVVDMNRRRPPTIHTPVEILLVRLKTMGVEIKSTPTRIHILHGDDTVVVVQTERAHSIRSHFFCFLLEIL